MHYLFQCFSVWSWWPPVLHVPYQAWFSWIGCYQTSAELDDELIIWIMHKGKQVGLQVCVWSSPCPEGGYLSQLQCSIFLRCCHLWWIEKCTLLCIYVTTVGMCRTNAVRKQSGYNLYMGWYLFWSVDEMVESTPTPATDWNLVLLWPVYSDWDVYMEHFYFVGLLNRL